MSLHDGGALEYSLGATTTERCARHTRPSRAARCECRSTAPTRRTQTSNGTLVQWTRTIHATTRGLRVRESLHKLLSKGGLKCRKTNLKTHMTDPKITDGPHGVGILYSIAGYKNFQFVLGRGSLSIYRANSGFGNHLTTHAARTGPTS